MKKTKAKNQPFYISTENTQEYRLPNMKYLYDGHKDPLYLYKELYDNVSVLESAITTYSTLVNSQFNITTSSDELSQVVTDICNSFNLDKLCDNLITDSNVYGFSSVEIVLNNEMNMIEKWVEIPPMELKIVRDSEGNIINYLQNSPGAGAQARYINSKRMLFVARHSKTDEPYGRSIFKTLPFLTRIMLQMQDSMGKIYQKYASPRFHVQYLPTVQLNQTTLDTRVNKIKDSFNELQVGKDFFTSGDVKIEVIGAGQKELKFNAELAEIMQGVFSGLGLPAGVLGYNYGSTETHLTQQIEVLLGKVTKHQKALSAYLNTTLMPMIAKVYNLPEVPVLGFDKSVIADEKVDVELEKMEIDNTVILLDKGLIDQKDAQTRLGLEIKQIEQNKPQENEDDLK